MKTNAAEHPWKGMTRAEIAAFEAIAINRSPRCSKRTLEALLSRGLIEKEERKSLSDVYFVPLPLHIQWCEWASERYRGKL
ncbi:hypothetical protein LRP30_40715 [Bradyrhizobium sp. C-145]|uniref:hypothetical protein n=1 Tax=Bradyrhizobium sp. C-145 TaxID=574727 RepID=UPI00201B46F6|nr:hypothetical protein [Bradyrhizobium sp. C-145]UQR62992.1 hypothetical protein LRP30_40715 [Bradyrhizobium sp. C-145]